MTPFDQLGLVRAAVEYINLMRVEVARRYVDNDAACHLPL